MTTQELINALIQIPGNPEIMIVDTKYNVITAEETGETAGIYEEFDVVYFEEDPDDKYIALMFINPEIGYFDNYEFSDN